MEFVPPDCPVEPAGYLKTFSKTLATVKSFKPSFILQRTHYRPKEKTLIVYALKTTLSDIS